MDSDVPNKIITLEGLEHMFESIRENTEWDMTKPMAWSYYFSHAGPEPLEALAEQLEEMGYDVLEIFQDDGDEEDEVELADPELWYLQVEREEVHTPESLDLRNDEFYRLASSHGLGYDGMEVGPLTSDESE